MKDKRLIIVIILIAIVIAVVVWLIYTQIRLHGLAGTTTAPGAAAIAITQPNKLPVGITNTTAANIAAANNGQYQMSNATNGSITNTAQDLLSISGAITGGIAGITGNATSDTDIADFLSNFFG